MGTNSVNNIALNAASARIRWHLSAFGGFTKLTVPEETVKTEKLVFLGQAYATAYTPGIIEIGDGEAMITTVGWKELLAVLPDIFSEIEWPKEKPPAMITIDDRALTFNGTWPAIEVLKEFQPWNKRTFGATGDFPQGKLNDNDEGGLRLGVAYDKLDGIVRIEFGKPVAWLGLPPPEAIQFARLLLRHAGAKNISIEM